MSDPNIEKLWFRRFQPSPQAASRLICFPHAGGSAVYYRPVALRLAGRADVLAVQYPGRQDRYTEPCLDDVRELAAQVHRVMGGLTDLPLTLFGHSMGASVAFEVARLLEADGHRLSRVFASGRRAPSRPHRGELVHQRDDDGIVAELKDLSGTDPAILADPEILRMVLPVLRSDYRAAETYRGTPGAVLTSPITALTGDADPQTPIPDAEAWAEHTSADFRLEVFPGGHFFLTERPQDVISLLADHLDALGAPA
ncbi:thioesterase II family protein [Kitasatospora viridis]|uniref:Surfactin synthase thioesterase subunit n=1 Tax=Kitasatospora viridis TaxID=281105 RepID=A0A561SG43_9ACTN|nr:alpha/beta fold hydrolase [Kitasatospora viridis]TWF73840.1 surfactin synthase thioesterase subunit [Kitasatospora viridis]